MRLTEFAKNGGCAGKIGPAILADVLECLPKAVHERLLVGLENSDDAGVYLLDNGLAIVQTIDFFSPIVDDPYVFGQIAAANSLSDIYAMGGVPLTALNVVCFPVCALDKRVLVDILRGGHDKMIESGAILVGGHTVENPEPKYGLSVTGSVHPQKIWTNAGAKPGDALVLTKALGTGVLVTAARAELCLTGFAAAIKSMITLNRVAAEIAKGFTVHACTDITGFGLLGHAYEMAKASQVQIEIYGRRLPLLPEATEAAASGFVPAGAYANRDYLRTVTFDAGVRESVRDVCFDPQTSGGLLFSVPEAEAGDLVDQLKENGVDQATLIGRVSSAGQGEIHVL